MSSNGTASVPRMLILLVRGLDHSTTSPDTAIDPPGPGSIRVHTSRHHVLRLRVRHWQPAQLMIARVTGLSLGPSD
eukprot:2225780-Rhodomonas_salina.2